MESWKRKLRMGMVGGGQGAFIGWVHRFAAALDQQIEMTAGCFSRDRENTKITGKQLYLDPERCYDTYQQMAEGEANLPVGKRIDFVAIVTPNVSHFDIAKTFLDAGIHVICDKPMTYSIEQAAMLADLVEKTQLVFAVTYNYTGHPMVRHARELFKSNQMGSVRKVMVEYLQDFLMFPHEKHGLKQAIWRVDPAQAGLGGALGDAGATRPARGPRVRRPLQQRASPPGHRQLPDQRAGDTAAQGWAGGLPRPAGRLAQVLPSGGGVRARTKPGTPAVLQCSSPGRPPAERTLLAAYSLGAAAMAMHLS